MPRIDFMPKLLAQVVSEIRPIGSDPNMRRIKVDGNTVATLRVTDIEALKIKVGQHWTVTLARAVDQVVATNRTRKAALGLLGRRPYSQAELADRLRGKNHAPSSVKSVLKELVANGWIDDAAYGRKVADEVIRKPASRRYLKSRLEARQIAPQLAEQIAKEAVTGIDPVEAALSLARRRLGSMAGLPVATVQRRVAGTLARRGFDEDVIDGVLIRLGIGERDYSE